MQIIPNLKEMARKRNTVVKIVKSNISFLTFVKKKLAVSKILECSINLVTKIYKSLHF